jgi:hypothetical protein
MVDKTASCVDEEVDKGATLSSRPRFALSRLCCFAENHVVFMLF